MYHELVAMDAKASVARRVAANSRRWWHNSAMLLNSVLTIAWFDRLGLPDSHEPQTLEPPGADPYAGWCGRGTASEGCPPMQIDDIGISSPKRVGQESLRTGAVLQLARLLLSGTDRTHRRAELLSALGPELPGLDRLSAGSILDI